VSRTARSVVPAPGESKLRRGGSCRTRGQSGRTVTLPDATLPAGAPGVVP
jgi:hypothetical protein